MTGWRKRTIMEMAQEAEFELDCVSLEWHKRIEAFAKLVREDALAQPAPVQEPIGYAVPTFDFDNSVIKKVHYAGTVPLYTTPPQRKPLTDEEITLIIADCASSHQHTDIHLARAIEQAHGITGENK